MLNKLTASVAAALLGLAMAGAAAAQPGGSYAITNSTSTTLTYPGSNSFGSGVSTYFPTTIASGSSGSGRAYALSGTNLTGTFQYNDTVTGYGCSFTTVIYQYSGSYQFSFTSSKNGGSSSPAACSFTASRSASTGSFTAYNGVSGF
jgi:hypothetical protein